MKESALQIASYATRPDRKVGGGAALLGARGFAGLAGGCLA